MKLSSKVVKAACFMAAFLCLLKLLNLGIEYGEINKKINKMNDEYVNFYELSDKNRHSKSSLFYSEIKPMRVHMYPYIRDNISQIKLPEKDSKNLIPEIDFDSLLKVNPDILGWLYIPDTNISFPVLKSHDNNEYLSLDYTGKYSIEGSIFLDKRIESLTGNYILIYGHNMKNGAMFGELDRFGDKEYLNNHDKIYLIKVDGTFDEYEVFSTETVSVTDEIYDVNNYQKNALSELLLSTCTENSDKEKRFVVHAKKLD